METIFGGIPNVAVYLDDILVTGKTLADHLDNLKRVLNILRDAGLRLKEGKCVSLSPEVEYLGHNIRARQMRKYAHTGPPTA